MNIGNISLHRTAVFSLLPLLSISGSLNLIRITRIKTINAIAIIRAGEFMGFIVTPYIVVVGIRVHNPPITDPNAVPNVAQATEIIENAVLSFKDI